MKSFCYSQAVRRSILIIALISFFQPYLVLITDYGRSNECWNCLIIEQTFLTSLFFLLIPLTVIYLFAKWYGMNPIIQGVLIVAYFVPVSFIKLTIPLFDDRIASWSTFSDEEVWKSAIIMSIPSFGLLSILIILTITKINK